MAAPEFDEALAEAQGWVGAIPGVVMVAEGEQQGRRVIEVHITSNADRTRLAAQVRGVPVMVVEGEEFVPLDEEP